MRIWALVAAVAMSVGLSGCTRTPEWTLFYYQGQQQLPYGHQTREADISNLRYKALQGYYDTLDQCQQKAKGLDYLTQIQSAYQCGHQCQLEDGMLECDQMHTFTPKH